MTYAEQFMRDRYAQTAVSTMRKGRYLTQPELSRLANYLCAQDTRPKGPMTPDHLKQIAVKWVRENS